MWRRLSALVCAVAVLTLALGSVQAQGGGPTAVQQAEALLDAGQTQEARAAFEAILANPQDPQADRALMGLIELHMAAGDQVTAINHIKQLLKGYPNSPHVPAAMLNLGDFYFSQGQMDKATVVYERVVRLNGSGADYARYKMAWCAFNQHENIRALELLVAVIKDTTHMGLRREALHTLPYFYAPVGVANKAMAFFSSLSKQVPGGVEVWELAGRLADIYYEQGRYAEAALLGVALAEGPPVRPGMWLLVGRCYEASGELDKARAAWGKLIALDPQGEAGQKARALLEDLERRDDH